MMMKQTKKKAAVLFPLLLVGVYAWAQVKIGVIDPQRVIRETTKGKQVLAALDSLGKQKQEQIDKMRNEVKALQQELLSPALSEDARQTKNLQLQDKQTRLNRLVEDSRREYQIKMNQEMEKLTKEILPVITEIGKAQGFTIILDISTAGIAYFDASVDITTQVVAKFNEK